MFGEASRGTGLAATTWLAVVFVVSTAVGQGRPVGESFFEGFAALDPERWYVSDGWSNGSYQNCLWSERAVQVQDGRLSLMFFLQPTEDREYLCGEVQTRAIFGHGTFEARMRTNAGSGLNAAFFTYIGPVHDSPHEEIDFEILTRDTSRVSLNTYVDGEPMHGAVADLPRATDSDFLTYSFVWEPDRIRWFVDGRLVHEVEGQPLPTVRQKIYLSLWGTDTLSDWMGRFEDPGRPLNVDVDWVAYTALGESCQFPESVLCALDE